MCGEWPKYGFALRELHLIHSDCVSYNTTSRESKASIEKRRTRKYMLSPSKSLLPKVNLRKRGPKLIITTFLNPQKSLDISNLNSLQIPLKVSQEQSPKQLASAVPKTFS